MEDSIELRRWLLNDFDMAVFAHCIES
jgi:hypothetical protein